LLQVFQTSHDGAVDILLFSASIMQWSVFYTWPLFTSF
jgi:hypothetical protein